MSLQESFLRKAALVVYVTCGDPDLETSYEVILSAIDAGADVIELGVPFSDPVADGPVIQRAMDRACRNNVSLSKVLALSAKIRERRSGVGLVLFSYLNPILRYGLRRFAADAKVAGIDGVLCTDMPVEESDEYVRVLRAHGLDTIFLAAPTSSVDRLRSIASASSGFIYAVSRLGVTGARTQMSSDARELVARTKQITQLPVAVGFGVSTAEHFQEVAAYADGVVVGSAIVSIIEREGKQSPQAVSDFIHKLKARASVVPAT